MTCGEQNAPRQKIFIDESVSRVVAEHSRDKGKDSNSHGAADHDYDATDSDSQHADLYVRYEFQCERLTQIKAIDVKLFDIFEGL